MNMNRRREGGEISSVSARREEFRMSGGYIIDPHMPKFPSLAARSMGDASFEGVVFDADKAYHFGSNVRRNS